MSGNIFQKITGTVGNIKIRSALNPMLWLCAINLPVLYSVVNQEKPSLWKIFIALTPIAITALGFLFLLLFDRDKLQSEQYQIQKQSLELIQDKGQRFPVVAPSIESISNPQIDDTLLSTKNPRGEK